MEDLPPGLALTAVAAAVIIGAVVAYWAVRAVSHYFSSAARQTPPTSLVASISLITILTVVGAFLTDYESAWTLAATGLGALAGSLTSWFQMERQVGHNNSLNDEDLEDAEFDTRHAEEVDPDGP